MPKLKTRKSIAKRVASVTASGRLLRRKTTAQHLVHRKSKRTRKNSGEKVAFSPAEEKKLKKLVPYL